MKSKKKVLQTINVQYYKVNNNISNTVTEKKKTDIPPPTISINI